jgi:hypothetical protein
MPSSQRSSISLQSSNQNNSIPQIQSIKLVQPISNVQQPIQPNANVSSGTSNNLFDDLLGPVSTPQSTNLSINTPKPSSSTSSNISQPINAFNTTKPISPTTPKQVGYKYFLNAKFFLKEKFPNIYKNFIRTPQPKIMLFQI